MAQNILWKDVTLIDGTNVDDPHSLDQFFMDEDIIDIAQLEIAEDDLNSNFYTKFLEFALKLWSGPSYPQFASDVVFP